MIRLILSGRYIYMLEIGCTWLSLMKKKSNVIFFSNVDIFFFFFMKVNKKLNVKRV